MKSNKRIWEDNSIQFPRLLAEIEAVGLTKHQLRLLSESMDLEVSDILEIIGRAQSEFENIKKGIK